MVDEDLRFTWWWTLDLVALHSKLYLVPHVEGHYHNDIMFIYLIRQN